MLIPVPDLPNLTLARTDAAHIADLATLAGRLPGLLEEARERADFVIMDTAPLGEVSDPLRFARSADDVLVVVRPGRTLRQPFETMRSLLSQVARPAGYLVVGSRAAVSSSYYYSS